MKKVLITGSLGLVGSAAVRYYLNEAWEVIGVDNDMRKHFFGKDASVVKNMINHPNYYHHGVDISKIEALVAGQSPDVIIHCAAQPSHDYSAKEPMLDAGINIMSTLMLLEFTRKYVPNSIFIYLSTNKVYGDWPNRGQYTEGDTRFEPGDGSMWKDGISETAPIDNCMHSPFGVSKLAGDLYVQEYAKYFGIKTGIFRCGCITGAAHAGAELHGFLSYMVKCKKQNKPYTIYGYEGKQVRDQIHADDIVGAIDTFVQNPNPGEVYNMGGGFHSNVSVLEALNWLKMKDYEYTPEARRGDHIWYISDISKFKRHYPNWNYKYNLWAIFDDLLR